MMLKAFKIITVCFFIIFMIVKIGENIVYKNISISEPLGYYLALPRVKFKKGDLVLTCITNNFYKKIFNNLGMQDVSGQCNNRLPYLIKRIVAIEGDSIRVIPNGILINGALYSNSKQFFQNRGVKLYPLPIGYFHMLTNDEYFLLGQSLHSLDSRYFGIVKRKDIFRKAVYIMS